jgi:hypothetical protein
MQNFCEFVDPSITYRAAETQQQQHREENAKNLCFSLSHSLPIFPEKNENSKTGASERTYNKSSSPLWSFSNKIRLVYKCTAKNVYVLKHVCICLIHTHNNRSAILFFWILNDAKYQWAPDIYFILKTGVVI